MAIRRWRLANHDKAHPNATGLVQRILAARDLDCGVTGRLFSDGILDSPFGLIDMDKAARRIHRAIEHGERIAVYGDYDCDGITSTAMLTNYLQSAGADVIYYIPSRENEGYGLNKGAVDILAGQNTELIVTVDNGISAHAEIDYASSIGIDTVVTDHHTPRPTLPGAVAVVNPHRKECPSRFKDLAGVGVAFKLICALEGADGSEMLEYYSDLAALGTIADVVPLTDENRVIVRHGLARMLDSDNAGIRALIRVSGLEGKAVTSESAAFGLIPRINASGRMGVADDAVELLLCDAEEAANEAAQLLDSQNALRKKIENDILSEIGKRLSDEPGLLTGRLLILAGESWHHGVVGIAAAKLTEKYGRPVILISKHGDSARGSGRSLPGFSLIDAISACSEKLLRYGGHPLAAGISLASVDIADFAASMELFAAKHFSVMPVPEITMDCRVEPDELTFDNIRSLDILEPFGMSNEQPALLLSGMKIEGIYPTSDGNHLRIRFLYGRHLFYAVYFRMTEQEFPYSAGDIVDVAAAVTAGEWNGMPQINVRILDMRPHGIDQEALITADAMYKSHRRGEYGILCDKGKITPSRDDIAVVYRYLKKCGGFSCSELGLYYKLMGRVEYSRMRIALDVLYELGLIESDGIRTKPREDAPKVELESSSTLKSLK